MLAGTSRNEGQKASSYAEATADEQAACLAELLRA